jgi:RimJ/RimL family protein N-acetyltransferase
LEGRVIRLEPLTLDHESGLLRISQDPRIWTYTTSEGGTPESLRAYLETAMRDYAASVALPFAVRRIASGELIGITRLKNLSYENRYAEVGSWLAPAAWGSGANAEGKMLLLTHAFEYLHCIRIEFQTDGLNARSRAALSAMGAKEEGTLRSRRLHRDGSRRDSVYFSILDAEWPAVKERLEARLAEQSGGKCGVNCQGTPPQATIK